MEQKVNINCMTGAAGVFRSQTEQVEKCRTILDEITGNLAMSNVRNTSVINVLKSVNSRMGQDAVALKKMEQGLLQGAQCYQNCEQRIASGYKSRDGNFISAGKENVNVDRGKKKKGEGINAAYDIFSNGIEKGLELGAGLNDVINITEGPAGPNSFIMMNPDVADEALKWDKVSTILNSKACKVGIPVIGGLIDFGVMLWNGEEVGDAAIKSTAHAAIGFGAEQLGKAAGTAAGKWLGTKIGGMIGATIGSAVPGVGTAIGGVIGAVAGSIIGIGVGKLASNLFDWAYDNREKIADNVGSIWDGTKKWVGDIGNRIGDAFVSNWNLIGSVFG